MKTIQFTSADGVWQNMLGHDCLSEEEMNQYIAKVGDSGFLRVADENTAGEPSSYVREAPVTLLSQDEHREQLVAAGLSEQEIEKRLNHRKEAVLSVLAALRDTKW